jgi:hypothetical protein
LARLRCVVSEAPIATLGASVFARAEGAVVAQDGGLPTGWSPPVALVLLRRRGW